MITLDELNRLNPHSYELNHSIHHYWESFCNGQYEECMKCTYPGIFKKFPKKKMLQAMKQVFQNKELIMSADVAEIDGISKIIETDKGSYCAIDYTLLMSLQYNDDLQATDEQEKKEDRKMFMLSVFEAQYGKDNTWYDEITKSYCFHQKNKIIAIKDDDYPQWSFISYNDNPYIRKIIPKEVFIILGL